jgi:hypothetical protein
MAGTTTNGFPYPLGSDRVRDGDDTIKALAEAIEAKLMPTAWANITLNTNFTARASYQVPAYRVFPDGKVELRGGVHKATSLVSGDFPFLTLPTTVKPTTTVILTIGVTRLSGVTAATSGRLDIDVNGKGTVLLVDANASNDFSLDGVFFYR